jgi:hypothetical protein
MKIVMEIVIKIVKSLLLNFFIFTATIMILSLSADIYKSMAVSTYIGKGQGTVILFLIGLCISLPISFILSTISSNNK